MREANMVAWLGFAGMLALAGVCVLVVRRGDASERANTRRRMDEASAWREDARWVDEEKAA